MSTMSLMKKWRSYYLRLKDSRSNIKTEEFVKFKTKKVYNIY